MSDLRQSTASQEISLGQFLDSGDGDTEENGLTIANTDIKIRKNGTTTLANKNSGGATNISNGVYHTTLDATDTDIAGQLEVYVHVAGALAVKSTFNVLTATAFDAKYTGTFNNLGGTAQSGDSFTRIGAAGASLTALQANLGQGIAQGGTSSTIQLASGESFGTNELRGTVVNITLGTGKGQSRWISANIGITDTCSIVPDWITTPDATSIYEIVQGSASMQAILDSDLNESSVGLLANNFDTFYNNNNNNTAKIIDDIGTAPPFPASGWIWSTATTGVPISGRIRGNNAAIASITELSIHEESDDGKNTGLVISSLRNGDRIQIFFETNPEIFLLFDVTATPILTGSVYAVTGTVDTTSGTFTNTKINTSFEKTIVTDGPITTSNGAVVLVNNINGNITATIDLTGDITGDLSGSVGSVTAPVTVGTNNDKIGYTVSGLDDDVITAASIESAAFTQSKFGSNFITSASIATGAINSDGIAVDAIGASEFSQAAADKMWSTVTRELTSGANIVLAKGVGLTGLNDITAASVLAAGDIDGFTLEESTKLILAASVGVLAGAATNSITIKAADGSKTRITATVDADGNRSAVIKDVTG